MKPPPKYLTDWLMVAIFVIFFLLGVTYLAQAWGLA